jgi:hypothetical protein
MVNWQPDNKGCHLIAKLRFLMTITFIEDRLEQAINLAEVLD